MLVNLNFQAQISQTGVISWPILTRRFHLKPSQSANTGGRNNNQAAAVQ